jgi:broad specificity phosphatase PhoE
MNEKKSAPAGEQTVTTLYLVRHGTTTANVNKTFQGVLDTKLNADGLMQAKYLGEHFKNIHLDVAYTSPLSRAAVTMQGVLTYHPEVPCEEVADLREIDGGLLQGLTFKECDALSPGIMETFKTNPPAFDPPQGESIPKVYRRFTAAVNALVRKNPGKSIVIVSHGTAIQTWLSYAQGRSAEQVRFQFMDNGAVSKFTFDEAGNLTICYMGDVSYVPEELRGRAKWKS